MILTPKQEQFLDLPQKMSIVVGPPGSGKTTMCLLSAIRACRAIPGYTVLYLGRHAVRELFNAWKHAGDAYRISTQTILFLNRSALHIKSIYDDKRACGLAVDWYIIDKGGMPIRFPEQCIADTRVTIILNDDWAVLDMGAVWREDA